MCSVIKIYRYVQTRSSYKLGNTPLQVLIDEQRPIPPNLLMETFGESQSYELHMMDILCCHNLHLKIGLFAACISQFVTTSSLYIYVYFDSHHKVFCYTYYWILMFLQNLLWFYALCIFFHFKLSLYVFSYQNIHICTNQKQLQTRKYTITSSD